MKQCQRCIKGMPHDAPCIDRLTAMDKLAALGRPKDPLADTATWGPEELDLVTQLRKVEDIGAGWGLPILDGVSLDVTCKQAADEIERLREKCDGLTKDLDYYYRLERR